MRHAGRTSSGGTAITAIASDVVVDASAVVRALIDHDAEAVGWLGRIARNELRATCPDLLYVEVANVVLVHQRTGRLAYADGEDVLNATIALPFATQSAQRLAAPAWAVASERGLSAYDACYVVLAELLGAPLVTADKRLAAATPNGVLLTG